MRYTLTYPKFRHLHSDNSVKIGKDNIITQKEIVRALRFQSTGLNTGSTILYLTAIEQIEIPV